MSRVAVILLAVALPACRAGLVSAHSSGSRFSSYRGLVMCGYQGWFRAEGDSSGQGWAHYAVGRRLDAASVKVDLWPDVSEYPRTYPTPLRLRDGTPARVFSSWDESAVDLHFRWMRDYGIDGVFMQRFFAVTRTPAARREGRVILGRALAASQKHGRAIAVMYDLSGIRAAGEDCSSVMQDWKELVDELKLTSQGTRQTYLYHRGQPLVAIWGLGFPDRPYDIRNIGLDRLLDFLKKDPIYGGCSVMLGVPTQFRELTGDCRPDPYLHELMARADVVMPWMVGRFSSRDPGERDRYAARVRADLAWCAARGLDYVPCVYPGFSWYNLSRHEFGGRNPLNQIPRRQGRFYWDLISAAVEAGAPMLYVAMFDEIDEGTAIFKCTNEPPMAGPPAQFVDYEGLPSDCYLRLTGEAGRMLRGSIPFTKEVPAR